MTLLEMCKFNYMFIMEVIVEGGGVTDYNILRGVSIFFHFPFTTTRGENIRSTP